MSRPESVAGWAPEPDASIWPYVVVLLRHPILTFVLPLLAAVAIGIYSIASPREYVARASFVLHESQSVRSAMGNLASQLGISTGSPSSSPQFYADLLQSRGLLYEAATSRYRVTEPTRFEGTLATYLEVKPDADSNTRNVATVAALKRRLGVSIDPKTSIVRFEVKMPSGQLAGGVARRLLDLVNEFDVQRRQSQVKSERAFLEQRTAEALQELHAAQQQETDFNVHNRQPSLPPVLRAQEQNIQRRLQLAQTTYLTLVQQYELAKVEAVRDTPVITVLDAPERFIERQPRGTLLKTALVFLVMAIFGAIVAFVRESLRRAGRADDADFQLAVAAWRGMRIPFLGRRREAR